MSGTHTPKITSESVREVLEFDSKIYGAGLYGEDDINYTAVNQSAESVTVLNKNTSEQLCKDILKIYQALKKASHFHPVIEILRRDAEVITKRLYGIIPKKEWQPEKTEQKLACLIYRKDHGKNPTRKEMQKIIDDIKERKFEVK